METKRVRERKKYEWRDGGGMVEGGGNDKKRRMRFNKKSFWSNRVLEF